MHRLELTGLLLLTAACCCMAVPVSVEGDFDLNYVLNNLTALWEEVAKLRHEVQDHRHGYPPHDQVTQEVDTLQHEMLMHAYHRPHEGHNDHHDPGALQHLQHHHEHHHDDHNHHDGDDDHQHQDHDHDDDDHDHHHHHHHHHRDGRHKHGLRRRGGDHGHSGDTHAHQGHDHSRDEHQHDDDNNNGNSENSSEEDDDSRSSGKADDHNDHNDHHHHHHKKDRHDSHGLHDHFEGAPPPERPERRPVMVGPALAPRRGLAVIPGREQEVAQQEDDWMHASCNLKPNADLPESTVTGTIIISQKKNESGPVFFHLNLEGFKPSQGRVHGFHIHSSPIGDDNRCSDAGGHFNPFGATHGGPHSDTRHVGDLGNIEVDSNGKLENYLVTDEEASLVGEAKIGGKSIVVHAGVDDLGLGGDEGSLATGNAGGRLACCNIHIQPESFYRFKG